MLDFINRNIENMKKDLADLVAVNSVYADDLAPFGKANHEVLDIALTKMAAAGLKTQNLDYYCGYGEVGEGEQVIGVVGHLDIVPAGDGWNSDPFIMTEKDGMLYGRGVSDDKGAVVASLYALKYLLETGYKFKKRVRLITGCNEETGSKCIAHYVEKEGHVDMGFTPDGNFPGIFAEKGMVSAAIKASGSKIKDIRGGVASNVVCKQVNATVSAADYNGEKFAEYLNNRGIAFDVNGDEIVVYGKAAHASMPDLGVNAIGALVNALAYAGMDDPFVNGYVKFIGETVHGELCGLAELTDAITNTSMNIGVISCLDGVISATVDVRFPVTRHSAEAIKCLEACKSEGFEFVIGKGIEPLYFDLNSDMIQALDKAYRTVTGDMDSKMEAIGGGTYAKAINNIIAFGCEFQGEDNHIHDANECLSIEGFKKQVAIYIEAIRNLNEI